jgi:hypothetical protein
MVKSGIDAALDQPGQGDAGEIGADQRENAEDKETAMAINEKLNTMVIAKNLCVPFLCRLYWGVHRMAIVQNLRGLRKWSGNCPNFASFREIFRCLVAALPR